MRLNFVRSSVLFTVLCSSAWLSPDAHAQSSTPYVEVGAQVTALRLNFLDSFDSATSPGIGGRATYHLTDRAAIEGEFNFFLSNDHEVLKGGRKIQGLFGVTYKVASFNGISIRAKARPGFVRFQESVVRPEAQCIAVFPPAEGCYDPSTSFAFDLGGIVEAPITPRIGVRFDIGDTMVRWPDGSIGGNGEGEGKLRHNLQVGGGVSFRF